MLDVVLKMTSSTKRTEITIAPDITAVAASQY